MYHCVGSNSGNLIRRYRHPNWQLTPGQMPTPENIFEQYGLTLAQDLFFSLSPFLPVYLKDRDRDLWLACSHMLSTARVGLGCGSEA